MSPHSRREVALPVKLARCKKMAGSFQLTDESTNPSRTTISHRPDLFRALRNPELTVIMMAGMIFTVMLKIRLEVRLRSYKNRGVCTARGTRVGGERRLPPGAILYFSAPEVAQCV